MKRASLFLALLVSCGPVYTEEILPRYAILTTIAPESPLNRSVQWLAEYRHAHILRFANFQKDRDEILQQLREIAPTYVAVIVKPEEIDTNFQLSFLEMACRLDEDIFPDFAYGYLPAADAASLKRLMQTIEGAEAKVEKRVLRMTFLEPGAAASSAGAERLEWATGLPRQNVAVKTGDSEFLHKHFPEIEGCDFLLLSGEGTPEGIRGLPIEEVQRMQLDTTAVFSGADYTGAAGASFDATREYVRRRTLHPEKSFTQNLLRNGAAAVFAPLEKTHAGLAAFEWADSVLSDEPHGWVMKHAYDMAILAGSPTAPSFGRFEEGKRPPEGRDSPLFNAATRVLYGDPMLKPFVRPTHGPIRQLDTFETVNAAGDPVLNARFQVISPDCLPYFTDPFSESQRLYLKIRIPGQTRQVITDLKGCEAGGKEVYSKITAQALEWWRGGLFLHLLIHGKDLARKDLIVTLSLTLK